MEKKPHLNLIFVGHVDHGKSTTVGRLLYETGAVTDQDLEKFKKEIQALGKTTFEWAFILDVSKDERLRGMTIDLAHRRFDTKKYYFTIIDAPGHVDFVKNMITGASQADAAVLVIDAVDGIQPQTREHAYLCKVLGVKQLIVAISKMDAANYDEKRFNQVRDEVQKFLKTIGYDVSKIQIIPISGLKGDNLVKPSENMKWWKGPTLVEALDNLQVPEPPINLPLRMPIQEVYSITGVGTVPVGRVVTGRLRENDKVIIQPPNLIAEVKSIEMHHERLPEAIPGDNVGVNLRGVTKEQLKRGDVIGHPEDPPTVAKEFTAQMVVLYHPTMITAGYTPVFHMHTAQVACKIKKILKKIDPRTGETIEENPESLKTGDVAVIVVEPTKPVVIEKKDKIPQLASFAIRDMGRTIGAGVCIDVVPLK
ncbi:MAG: translation elongation factor EF-1 subunit alpha [Candidatus Nanoarchaeia archaeon]|nr:translation elongation factor EF-1 subunit alpha [Candidatus Haiyanarchaeum thermophilum]MCW1303085.1 translation elongation factor EF-1 subunit alpha [Candidatus Haiyanarchaeum thermophilum]MCW1303750.1 translation elongation factor EF-1 subunit alpha [Candidatus Haiyanarchaeum thermophilum]MCW1307047.1 translation elongation factor EF-1 subunit alpha [Candidatus Haiyanarchaeum thermophilum]MCW1307718.1 translation elongation factor EF-1 subunit alpha [Candidatus Haiyanarchaeum thermophilum